MKYVLAHDFGTSADKAALFTVEGELAGSCSMSYPTIYREGDQVEQDAHTWWKAFCDGSKKLLHSIDPADVICVSFDGASPNCLCVDKDLQPLHKTMIWQDNRASLEAEEISALLPEKYLKKHPKHKVSTDRTLAKLLWVKKHQPEVFEKTWKVLPCVPNYIVMRLTGRVVCDYGVARTTAMLDADNRDWADEILEIAGIPRKILPELMDRTGIAGVVPETMSEACGLAPGTPIVVGTIDNACTQIGAGILRPGDIFIIGGTSASVEGLDNQGGRIGKPTSASGASLNWAKNQLCEMEQLLAEQMKENVFDVMNREIEASPVGSNGVIFHPYMAGARSVLDNPYAKGAFLGLSLTNTRSDMLRSVVEGIGFNLNLILQSIRDTGVTVTRMPIVGGLGNGAVVRQIFADIMDVELVTHENMDVSTAVGAAVLGGIALGLYENESTVERFIRVKDVTRPIPENVEKYRQIAALFRELYDRMVPVYDKM